MNFLVLLLTLVLTFLPLSVHAEEQNVLEFLKDMKINGMLDTYYSYNLNRPASRTTVGGGETNRFRAFDLEDNSLTVDNFELILSKPSTEDSRGGFTVITNYGEIAQRIVFDRNAARGEGRVDDDDFTISTGYVSFLADVGSGLDLKMGRFPTWIGAEVWESVDNPNWSRSLLYQNAIPFTHTGVSAGYGLSDTCSVTLYGVNGWDSFQDDNSEKSYGFRLAYETDEISFYINTIRGNESDDGDATGGTRSLADFILDMNPTKELHLNINYDTGSEENRGHWQGLAAIIDYDFSDAFNLALRGEYFKDVGVNGVTGRTGVAQDSLELYEVTVTANFHVSDKVMVRPEVRHDWSRDRVFDGNTQNTQTTLACSVAYIF